MRLLRDQTLASTHTDRSGDRIPSEALRTLFDQLSSETISGVMHDISRPPIVRILARRLEELPDGELAIKIDYEILDEEAYAEMGGFSISFLRGVFRSGAGAPMFRVLVNPDQFDVEAAAKSLRDVISPQTAFDVVERVEKALGVPEAILIVCLWMGGEILRGFLAGVGADLLKTLRSLPRRDGVTGSRQIQITFHVGDDSTHPNVILRIPDHVESAAIGELDLQTLDSIRERSKGCRVVCVLEPGGSIRIEHTIGLSPELPDD